MAYNDVRTPEAHAAATGNATLDPQTDVIEYTVGHIAAAQLHGWEAHKRATTEAFTLLEGYYLEAITAALAGSVPYASALSPYAISGAVPPIGPGKHLIESDALLPWVTFEDLELPVSSTQVFDYVVRAYGYLESSPTTRVTEVAVVRVTRDGSGNASLLSVVAPFVDSRLRVTVGTDDITIDVRAHATEDWVWDTEAVRQVSGSTLSILLPSGDTVAASEMGVGLDLLTHQRSLGHLGVKQELGVGCGLVKSRNNPVFAEAMEMSLIFDGEQLDAWHRHTDGIYYAYSTDPWGEVWTRGNGGDPISEFDGMEMPFVFRVGSTYYCAINDAYDIYLWESADKITWTQINAGNPIATKSGTPGTWNERLYNPAIAAVGNTWHLMVDGALGGAFQDHYSYGTFDPDTKTINFDTNMSAAAVIAGATSASHGAPFMRYFADRGALLVTYGEQNWRVAPKSTEWVMRAKYGLLTDDLTVAANWHDCPGFGVSVPNIILSDSTMVFAGAAARRWKMLFHYNYDQVEGHQAYCQLDENEFFDAITESGSPGNAFVGRAIEAQSVKIGHHDHNVFSADTNGSAVLSATHGGAASRRALALVNPDGQAYLELQDVPTGLGFQLHCVAGGLVMAAASNIATPGVLGTKLPLTILASGFVGVGLSVPTYPLHVYFTGGGVQYVSATANPGGVNVHEMISATKAVQLVALTGGEFRIYVGATPKTLGTLALQVDATGTMALGGATAGTAGILLDMQSTTKAFRKPCMTTAQRLAIAPLEGMEVYDTTLHTQCFYNGTNWQKVTSSNAD